MSATPTGKKPTVKQQRAIERERKLEEFKKREARMKRNRRIAIWSSVAVGVAIIALIVTSVVLTPRPATYSAGGSGAEVEGVETFENAAGHVEGAVDYAQTPPAGGEHNPAWLNCGIYEEPVPNENAVHSMEHGAVWVTYDADALSGDEVANLRSKLPSTYVILSPYDGLPSPIVLSGWNAQLQVDDADDPRIGEFLEEYWLSQSVPEPGASCAGAIDGAGKVS
ncbi:hypothetical protein BCL57_000444 [Agromyces flavus]|uniref:DUF3105 domain-containing protein n=1 Tax=Agromyces flavus TaxID=589382 RepID=A0A1H1X2N2_9MICO|nr:DUF3105 domain-containing protein [Agromyces flavus]MCP2366302.1 hypothetical protein [Agromyces flavus]GGI44402.1 membrane protein [Agromyces flavus]SDT02809.1 Protein of unknown function [Agromyces flavus]